MWSSGALRGRDLLLLGCALLLGLSQQAAQARSFDDVITSGYLSVGVYRDFPPYAYEEDGRPRGVDVELAKILAEGLGVELKLHWMLADENLDDDLRNHVWKGHYLARIEDGPMLQREVADVMLRVPYDREFAFRVDPDGRVINDLVHFFAPYQRERWALGYDRGRLEPFENLALFQYERVGVEIDSLPDFYLSSAFGGRLRNNVQHFPSVKAAVADLAGGGVPAVMGMESQLRWAGARLNQAIAFGFAEVPFPNLSKRHWDVGMAVHDNHRQLAYRLEDQIDRLVEQGTLARLYEEYGLVWSRPDRYRLP